MRPLRTFSSHSSKASMMMKTEENVGGSRTYSTVSMEILLIYILKDWKEDLSSYGEVQLSMKTL
jgi:hypothetical protein